jgi:hypothetical protein
VTDVVHLHVVAVQVAVLARVEAQALARGLLPLAGAAAGHALRHGAAAAGGPARLQANPQVHARLRLYKIVLTRLGDVIDQSLWCAVLLLAVRVINCCIH